MMDWGNTPKWTDFPIRIPEPHRSITPTIPSSSVPQRRQAPSTSQSGEEGGARGLLKRRRGHPDSPTTQQIASLCSPAIPAMSLEISINVPDLSREARYERLPGHDEVKKILKQLGPDQFEVKLGSREVESLSREELKNFRNNTGAFALNRFFFNFREMSRRAAQRRKVRKETSDRAERGVEMASVDSSESDASSTPELGGRRKMRQSTRQQRVVEDSDTSVKSKNELVSSDEADGESEFEASQPLVQRSRRAGLRNSNSANSGDDFINDLSDDQPSKRRRTLAPGRKVRGKLQARIDVGKRGSSAGRPIAGARRSERTRTQARQNMREMQEHEISSNTEDEADAKVVATKEYFESLSKGDPFRDRHNERCDTCGIEGDNAAKGTLVFCQGCTASYHKTCLGYRGTREHLVTKVGDDHFVLQCRRCLGCARRKDGNAPHYGQCSGCNELGPTSKEFRLRLTTREEQLLREENHGVDPIIHVDPSLIDSPQNILFRCVSCRQAWHMHHLPSRDHLQEDEEEDAPVDEAALADLRFDYYSKSGTCKDCIEHVSAIDALVAWRPTNLEDFIPGSLGDMIDESQKEYLIKWKGSSYFRTTWMPGGWVYGMAAGVMRSAFMKKPENDLPKMTTQDAIPEDWMRVDIVFDVVYTSVVSNRTKEIDYARAKEVDMAFVKYKGLGYEFAIWEKPPSHEEKERWHDFKLAYDTWVLKHYVHTPVQKTLRRHLQTVRTKNFATDLEIKMQPTTLTGGELMGYQLDGVNWLYYQWFISQNCILADEMGLGKTIQLIGFFACMVQDHKCFPFLVVVPNSTCPNWRREIQKWAPSLRAVTYYGSSLARKLTQDHELFSKADDDDEWDGDKAQSKDLRAHIVICSYESVVEEKVRNNLRKIAWAGLVVDEGQRLKNEKNLLHEHLSKIKFPFKVLLTGTPLQNNARELFNLLQFLDPTKVNAASMDTKYESLTKEKVAELHDMIRPYFLRRTKAQVLDFLPPMAQIILPVSMSLVQKKVYKSILAKNPQLMKSIFSRSGNVVKKERVNLNNILMMLRKTLCHPFVYSREIEEIGHEKAVTHRNLVDASSKLQLLELMLPKLYSRGHRVLIFSQFLENLDIVEDFLDGLQLLHRRLDGSVDSLTKQKRIDEFNAPDSPYFAFLLSTRAGGVGINLATADTVIIMDPDFNPHQDMQALSRAHRIGQKKKVLVFQIMTRGSAEEKIMQIGKKKMVLDHILIQQMDQADDAGMDLESILRHGADALFAEDNADDITYDSLSVDKLLDRSQIETASAGEHDSAESQFSFARVWANDKATLEDSLGDSGNATPGDTTVWERILQERERVYEEEAKARAQAFGRGKRKRLDVNYGVPGADNDSSPLKTRTGGGGSDTDFQEKDTESEAGDESDPAEEVTSSPEGVKAKPKSAMPKPAVPKQATPKAPPFTRVTVPTGKPHIAMPVPWDQFVPNFDIPPPTIVCLICGQEHPMGWCKLKEAGVEHCGLCGIAHLGHGRTCPHLGSETQVCSMLNTLRASNESLDLIEKTYKYLRMVRGGLVQRKKNLEHKEAQEKDNEQVALPHRPDPSLANGNSPAPPVQTFNPMANSFNPTPPVQNLNPMADHFNPTPPAQSLNPMANQGATGGAQGHNAAGTWNNNGTTYYRPGN